MALARWQRTIVDEAGNILPGAQITVRREVGGAPLAVLYSDRDGLVTIGNPFTADADGFAAFHVLGGAHRIDVVSGAFSRTLRYVAIGTAAETDIGIGAQAWDADLDAIAALAGTGLTARTADATWAERTITGTAGEIEVANGGGVADNPTLSLPARVDLGGKVLEIPNSAAPVVDANGEIAIDTTVTDFAAGVIKYFGGEEMAVIAVPVAELTTPSDGDVIAYNATNDEFELVPQSGGGGTWTYASEAATTSGTAVTIASGLPPTVREIEIMLLGVSTNSADVDLVLRLGDSGGFETTGYTSIVSTAAGASDTATAGFYLINPASFDAATTIDCVVRLICYNDDNTLWHMTSVASQGSTIFDGLGRKDLSAAITQLQLTTLEGTPTFDAGTVSVRYR